MKIKNNTENMHVKFPFTVKVSLIFFAFIVFLIGIFTLFVIRFTTENLISQTKNITSTINAEASYLVEQTISTAVTNTLFFTEYLQTRNKDDFESSKDYENHIHKIQKIFFENNVSIIAILKNKQNHIINDDFFTLHNISLQTLEDINTFYIQETEISKNGCLLAMNISPLLNIPVVALFIPYKKTQENLIMLFSLETLTEQLNVHEAYTTFIINPNNYILLHPQPSKMMYNVRLIDFPLFTNDLNHKKNNIIFKDKDNTEYFGAYTKLLDKNMIIITTIKKQIVFKNFYLETYRTLLFIGILTSISIILISLLGKKVTQTIVQISNVVDELKKGNYAMRLFSNRNDELGFLVNNFQDMIITATRYEKIRTTFGRFIDKSIFEKLQNKNIVLNGQSKTATLLLVRVKNFNYITEKLSPPETIEFLNEYMTCVITAIKKTGGNIEKHIGDSMTANWGVPIGSGNDKQDAFNCVLAALLIRNTLVGLNKKRKNQHKNPIHVSCGIHTGTVIAGKMGAPSRMEYSFIGEAINFTLRCERLNKLFATDILITESTYNCIKDKVLAEVMPDIKLKRKQHSEKIYAVINIPFLTEIEGLGEHGPKTIHAVRNLIGVNEPHSLKKNEK